MSARGGGKRTTTASEDSWDSLLFDCASSSLLPFLASGELLVAAAAGFSRGWLWP